MPGGLAVMPNSLLCRGRLQPMYAALVATGKGGLSFLRKGRRMNLRERGTLDAAAKRVDELIEAGRKLGPMYTENPKLVADSTRKAKWLRAAIKAFRDFLDKPKDGKTPTE